MFKKIILLATFISLASCGTIISGTSQNISVTATEAGKPVEGAACVIDNESQKYYVTTPGTISVDKSKKDIVVSCEKDGKKSDIAKGSSDFNATTLLGILLDFGIISIPTDLISGATWEYPPQIQASFSPSTPQTQPEK